MITHKDMIGSRKTMSEIIQILGNSYLLISDKMIVKSNVVIWVDVLNCSLDCLFFHTTKEPILEFLLSL